MHACTGLPKRLPPSCRDGSVRNGKEVELDDSAHKAPADAPVNGAPKA